MTTNSGLAYDRTTAPFKRPTVTRTPVRRESPDLDITVPAIAIAMLIVGAIEGYFLGERRYAKVIWEIGLVGAGLPVVLHTIRGMLRGTFAADLVASLSIVTAAIIYEPLAGL